MKRVTVLICVLVLATITGCFQGCMPKDSEAVISETSSICEETSVPTTEPDETVQDPTEETETVPPANIGVLNMNAVDAVVDRSNVVSVTFMDSLASKPADAWDVSEECNASVMAWSLEDETGLHLYIAGDGGVRAPESCARLFAHMYALEELSFNASFDTSGVTDMIGMFCQCHSLRELDLSGFETSNVISMSDMFSACYALEQLNLSGMNTSSVEDMSYMFYGCNALDKVILTELDTSSVEKYAQFLYAEGTVNGKYWLEYFESENSGIKAIEIAEFDMSAPGEPALYLAVRSGDNGLRYYYYSTEGAHMYAEDWTAWKNKENGSVEYEYYPVNYEYYPDGNLKKKTIYSENREKVMEYSQSGVLQAYYSLEDPEVYDVKTTYDWMGRLTEYRWEYRENDWISRMILRYSYMADGGYSYELWYLNGPSENEMEVMTHLAFLYDSEGKPINWANYVVDWRELNNFWSSSFDPARNVRTISGTNGYIAEELYDSNGRLIAVNEYRTEETKQEDGTVQKNRLLHSSEVYVYGADGKLIKAGDTEYVYDVSGKLIREYTWENYWKSDFGYSDSLSEYEYDSRGNLVMFYGVDPEHENPAQYYTGAPPDRVRYRYSYLPLEEVIYTKDPARDFYMLTGRAYSFLR